jgi:FkbM family methyltransferase
MDGLRGEPLRSCETQGHHDMRLLKKLASIYGLLSKGGPELDVSLRWLLHSSSRIEARFLASTPIVRRADGEFQYFNVKGREFVWPLEASPKKLFYLLSELLEEGHPHHYEWGSTKIAPGDHVLDIGCCEGGFAAEAVLSGARVTAIEPSKANTRLIKRLFLIRNLPSPEIINCLLGSEVREMHFEDIPSNPGGSSVRPVPSATTYPVPMLTLDTLMDRGLLGAIDFIKCDAEGNDAEILKGGERFLERYHPKIAVTTYHRDGDFREIHEFLSKLGYTVRGKGFLFSGDKLVVLMLHAWKDGTV